MAIFFDTPGDDLDVRPAQDGDPVHGGEEEVRRARSHPQGREEQGQGELQLYYRVTILLGKNLLLT